MKWNSNGIKYENREKNKVTNCGQRHRTKRLVVDKGKNPSQQKGSLLVPQVLIRLMNIWYGRTDKIMVICFISFHITF